MTDPFAAYGHRATTVAVPRLVGVMRTRVEAKARYSEIVRELSQCDTSQSLGRYLNGIEPELVQYRTELDLFWSGDGDFAGLQREIERAQVRLDDGLDYPRHDPAQREGTEA